MENRQWESMEALRQAVLVCQRCNLAQGRTNVVFGGGNPHAKVMIVGEGPGQQEDLQGDPFVGRSGQLLDKMLAYVGLTRQEHLYIANMVKCRPPQNRDPAKDEVAICLNWLRSQTRLIAPKIILCLGRISATALIAPDFKVTRQHGQFIQKGNILFMGTYHPAALLRTPSNKPTAMEDFLALRAKMEELRLI